MLIGYNFHSVQVGENLVRPHQCAVSPTKRLSYLAVGNWVRGVTQLRPGAQNNFFFKAPVVLQAEDDLLHCQPPFADDP